MRGLARRASWRRATSTSHRSLTTSERTIASKSRPVEHEAVDVGLDEAELGVALTGAADGGGREVDAHPERRLERGQQVAIAAANVEHALAGRNQGAVDGRQAAVVGAAEPTPGRAALGDAVRVGAPRVPIADVGRRGRHGWGSIGAASPRGVRGRGSGFGVATAIDPAAGENVKRETNPKP